MFKEGIQTSCSGGNAFVTVVLKGSICLLQFLAGVWIFSFLDRMSWRLSQEKCMVEESGACVECGTVRSWRHLGMECTGGVMYIVCMFFFGCQSTGILSLKGLVSFFYLGILTIVAWTDWDSKTIYNHFHVWILLLGVAALWIFPEHGVQDRLSGMVAASLPMLLIAVLTAGAFGSGDIKLMAFSGFFLGWRAIIFAMFAGLTTGGVYCVLMMMCKKLGRKDTVALGPFLALGLAAALFWGDEAAGWYLSAPC